MGTTGDNETGGDAGELQQQWFGGCKQQEKRQAGRQSSSALRLPGTVSYHWVRLLLFFEHLRVSHVAWRNEIGVYA